MPILASVGRSVYHRPMTYQIFIDGGAGTTGLQVLDRLDAHPDVKAVRLSDDLRKDSNARRDMMAASDITILCLPDDAARDSAVMAANLGARVIDASSAHRTDPDWAYGFAELAGDQRAAIAGARQISNPGCYPTGFLALTRPLIDAGILPTDALVTVPAVSGYSGGGNAMINRNEAGELPPHGSYGVSLQHKHIPEMAHYSGLSIDPIFMPSVGNFYAGMLVHLPLHAAQLCGSVTGQDIYDALAAHFDSAAFVRMGATSANDDGAMAQTGLLAADALAGQNHMELFVFHNDASGQFWLTARLDNLGNGASGAAVQNMNIVLGLDETTGLV